MNRIVLDDLHIPTSAGGHAYRASYRAQPQGGDGMTRKLLIAAGVLGGLLLAGMGGWALVGKRAGPVPVIEADTRPIRVKPDNAGGMQVAGADEQVMGDQAGGVQRMAPPAEAPAPQALRAQMQPVTPAGQQGPAVPAAPPGPSFGASPLPDTARAPGRGTASAGAVQAGAVQPGAAQPGVVQPGVVQPGVLQSGAAVARPGVGGVPAAASATLVQLAAVGTEQGAQAEWQRLAKRMPDVLGDRRLVLQRADRDGKAVWRVRTGGFADVADATAFCARLRAKRASCTIAAF